MALQGERQRLAILLIATTSPHLSPTAQSPKINEMKRHFCEPGPLPGKPLPYRAGCCSLSTQKHKTRDPFSEKSVVFYLHYPTLGSPMISRHDHLCLQATKYQPFPFTHAHVENQCKTLSVLVWVRTGKKKKGVVIPVLPPTQVGGETEKLSAGKTYSITVGFLAQCTLEFLKGGV